MEYNIIVRNFTKILLFIFLLCLSQSTSSVIIAQGEDVSINIVPTNPKPFGQATISVESFALSLNNAQIDWRANGKTVLSGQGKTTYTFTVGGPNTSTTLDITIIPNDGSTSIKKTINITPSDIDLLWESVDSYTPPFYKGKALPTKQSQIKIVAFPNTSGLSQTNQKNITYSWKNNFNTIKNASGTGKNKYIFSNSDIKNTEKISVEALGPGGAYKASGSAVINIESPQVLFYKKSPLEGILYQTSLKDGDYIQENEITLVVEPLFMTFKDGASSLKYTWKINGNSIETPDNPRELTVRPSSRGGYATIEFGLENTSKLFQSIVKSLRVEL